jgi:hypothetical protein
MLEFVCVLVVCFHAVDMVDVDVAVTLTPVGSRAAKADVVNSACMPECQAASAAASASELSEYIPKDHSKLLFRTPLHWWW